MNSDARILAKSSATLKCLAMFDVELYTLPQIQTRPHAPHIIFRETVHLHPRHSLACQRLSTVAEEIDWAFNYQPEDGLIVAHSNSP